MKKNTENEINIIVQASSRSWQGGRDLCMKEVEGKPALIYNIDRLFCFFSNPKVIVAAPEFDKGGHLDQLFCPSRESRVSVIYAADASPLKRMIVATEHLENNDYIIRVDGLHVAALLNESLQMLILARKKNLDCVKFPDDFPAQLTTDIYRVGALRKLATLPLDPIFEVHPKYAFFYKNKEFKTAYMPTPDVPDTYLLEARNKLKELYSEDRIEVTTQGIEVGDQLKFHYEIALEFLKPRSRVLDIACGNGYGSRMLASQGHVVLGGDLDTDIVEKAKQINLSENVDFHVLDITDLQLKENSFDAVVCMETIEHVDDVACLKEIYRVLKSEGILVLSTPQNSLGHIPINGSHLFEYSVDQIRDLVKKYFDIVKMIGIKQGRISIVGSQFGNNTVLVCRKR